MISRKYNFTNRKMIQMEDVLGSNEVMSELREMDMVLGIDCIELLSNCPRNVYLKTALEALLNDRLYTSYDMSGKLEGVPSLSTSCTINPICQARQKCNSSICKHCFAEGQQNRYYMSRLHCIRNYYLLNTRVIPTDELPRINSDILRLESFGDLGSEAHFINFIHVVEVNPSVICTLWSKNYTGIIDPVLDEGYYKKPSNMILIQSSETLNHIANYVSPHADHVFTVYEKRFIEKYNVPINCGAKSCRGCMLCYTLNNPQFAIAEIKK